MAGLQVKKPTSKFFAIIEDRYSQVAITKLSDNKEIMLSMLATDLQEENFAGITSTALEMEDLDIRVYEVLSEEVYEATSAGVTLTKK